MEKINYFKNQIRWITLREAVVLLRHLSEFQRKDIMVRNSKGYRRMVAVKICELFSPFDQAASVQPVYFYGGPTQVKLFKGTYLTLIIDRCLLVSFEKGVEYVDRMIQYARGFAMYRPPACNANCGWNVSG